MSKLKDRFGQEVNLGDQVVYGANNGLVIGVVVKWNPQTFQIRSTDKINKGLTNIPYGYRENQYSLAKIKSITNLDESDLTVNEINRINADKELRSQL